MVNNVIVPANKNNYPPVGFGKSWCMKQMMGSFKLFEYHRKIIGVLMMGFKESCDIKICVWELLLKKVIFIGVFLPVARMPALFQHTILRDAIMSGGSQRVRKISQTETDR